MCPCVMAAILYPGPAWLYSIPARTQISGQKPQRGLRPRSLPPREVLHGLVKHIRESITPAANALRRRARCHGSSDTSNSSLLPGVHLAAMPSEQGPSPAALGTLVALLHSCCRAVPRAKDGFLGSFILLIVSTLLFSSSLFFGFLFCFCLLTQGGEEMVKGELKCPLLLHRANFKTQSA